MREIKFRAWIKEDKKMINPRALYFFDKQLTCDYQEEVFRYINKPFSLEDCVLMQYTGIKDKKGREIYEGDIVKKGNLTGIAEFNTEDMGSCGCCWPEFYGVGFVIRVEGSKEYFFGAMEIDECEVVGNIYENPELIED